MALLFASVLHSPCFRALAARVGYFAERALGAYVIAQAFGESRASAACCRATMPRAWTAAAPASSSSCPDKQLDAWEQYL